MVQVPRCGYPMRVYSGRSSRPSSRLLQERLSQIGYEGRDICYGYRGNSVATAYNGRVGDYNKRTALLKMRGEGIPTPALYLPSPNAPTGSLVDCDTGGYVTPDYSVIGRPDRHRAGKHFYFCTDQREVDRAISRGATHFLEYIEGGREFRVHIAFGKSIKLAEKVGGTGYVKTREHGWYFAYPQDFNHKVSMREVAKEAVMSLGLDFGAVDVIYKDRQYYVLEVNSAPALTSRADTLERYARAFVEESQC